ncbi:MAG: hydrolase, partial [Maribacter sp.]|nr:hydrolase [Maribacter sp.]
YKKTDHDIMLSSRIGFQDQSEIGLGFTNSYTFLTDTDDFDPTNTDGGIPLPNNQGYHFNSIDLEYMSNSAKILSFMGRSKIGRFFNGNIYSIGGTVFLRLQPKAQISLTFNYDNISLPDPYPSADLWLISPKAEITFSKSLFWSTLVQYSNQRDNLGFNSRLQWRFAPLSDLYIVYNDNYFVNQFSPRYRSINLKLTYWLNI